MSAVQFIGVDVAQAKFDVSFQGHKKVFQSDAKGLKDFLDFIKKHTENPWVCMESTSVYSQDIANFLLDNEITSSIVNPMQVKHFTKAHLLRNKNDTVDAKAIEAFAQALKPRPYQKRSDDNQEMNELAKLINMLKTQCSQLKNQLHACRGKQAEKALKKQIKQVEGHIKRLEKQVDDIIKKNDEISQSVRHITSIPGLGDVTAVETVSVIDNIDGFDNAKQFAAFIGVTPQQNQSGQYTGRTSMSKIGSGRLRRVLYMASLSAMRFNKLIKPMVERLKAAGKPGKVIIGAVMRKLAQLIFGVLKNQRPFDENYLKR